MTSPRTLTFLLMDAPYESARSTTALRLVDAALRRGFNVNVFAYEGAVYLPFSKQAPHANAVHGRSVEEEDHPNPKDWIAALLAAAATRGSRSTGCSAGSASTSGAPVNRFRARVAAVRRISSSSRRARRIPS
jgi:tRNA 2-thiouridine synthesizing protein D